MCKYWPGRYSGLNLLLLLSLFYANNAYAGQENEFIRDGGFELGIIDVDIVRFPRYTGEKNNNLKLPARDEEKPLSGHYSLHLPGLSTGGYRLVYRTMPLVTDEQYQLSLDLRVAGKPATIRLEAFTGWKRMGEKRVNLKSGKHHISFKFNTTDKPKISTNEMPVFVRIWVNSKDDVWLDNISLRGPSGSSGPTADLRAWLEPDKNMAVYPVNGEGNFTLRTFACKACQLSYRILDPIYDSILSEGNLKTEQQDNIFTAKLPLILSKRGFYWVIVQVYDQQKKEVAEVKHSYVVINPDPVQVAGHERFGMAMEEYGPKTQIDAFVYPEEYYKLAQQIGVGSVRVFSLLMPDMLSTDGIRFNFSEADAAISLMKKYGIEPMIELGNNDIYRTARWMRDYKPSKNSLDLIKGLSNQKDRKRFKRSQKYGQYLNLDKYQIYLEAVFSHFKDKIKYYELWNEPGHKFAAEDFIRIAEITRKVQRRIAPDSFLLGYSSTRKGRVGAGKNSEHMPEFISKILLAGGIKDIDILSYHSGHAFLFMNEAPDYRNQETGYVQRLKTLLRRVQKPDMPIWDSERGIPWKSSHEQRLDYKSGAKRWKHARSSENVLDVAKQLPMVYAAAFANNIERLFWFYFESSADLIQRAEMRWGFFDAQREPMPQIAVYDAMTELLEGAIYEQRLDSARGTRVYIFRRLDEWVILGYNWQGNSGTILLDGYKKEDINMRDIMGNVLHGMGMKEDKIEIPITNWPRYIILPVKKGGSGKVFDIY